MTQETRLTKYEPSTNIVIAVSKLYKSFGSKVVLKDLSIELKQGENLVILGRSGCGKSVLIKCIISLLQPDNGTITVLGKNMDMLTHEELDQVRARMGFLFQSNALYDSMTVRDNLEFPMRRHLKHLTPMQANERVLEVLHDVGLAHTVDMLPAELSGGMQKRIALARTLILKPEIILYDEPTSGLDPVTGREISTLITAIQAKYQTSSIIISHDMNCVKRTSDRIIALIDGTCYAEGTYDELRKSNDTNVKQFFEL